MAEGHPGALGCLGQSGTEVPRGLKPTLLLGRSFVLFILVGVLEFHFLEQPVPQVTAAQVKW